MKSLEDLTVISGNEFSFEVLCFGNPSPNFHWYKDDVEIKNGLKYEISSEKEVSKIMIKSTTIEDAGSYKVIAKNDLGEMSSSAKVIVTGN